jgi:hypothetical protein
MATLDTAPMPVQGHTQDRAQPRPTREQQLFSEVESVFRRFMYFPHEHAYTVATLWVAHTHLRTKDGDFLPYVTPRLYYGSMSPGCGKTLALELTATQSFRGSVELNPTEPGLISMYHNDKSTACITEIDKFFGDRGHSKEGHKAVINSGYRKGATVKRERGGVTEPRRIHGPMALDGKNAKRFLEPEGPFDAVRSRSVAVILDRKPDGVDVAEYDPQRDEARLIANRDVLAHWGLRFASTILARNVDKLIPAGINNRDKETWRVLFQVAAHVGGDWVRRLQDAARALILGQWGEDEQPVRSFAQQLLDAVQAVYGPDERFLPSRVVCQRVMEIDGWWRQEWSNPRAASMGLAAELATFGIEATREYVNGKQERGYALMDLLDVESDDDWTEPEATDASEWDWSELDDE